VKPFDRGEFGDAVLEEDVSTMVPVMKRNLKPDRGASYTAPSGSERPL